MNKRRIEITFAIIMLFSFAAACALSGQQTVFLQYHGMNDAQISNYVAVNTVLSLVASLLISKYGDEHPTKLKQIVTFMYGCSVALVLVLYLCDLPLLLFMAVYMLATLMAGGMLLLNSIYMQYINNGIDVDFGWPRGIGSVSYAIFSYIVGAATAAYNPDIVLPIFIGVAVLMIIAIILLPTIKDPKFIEKEKKVEKGSYLSIIKNNKTFALFLLALFFQATALSINGTYYIRIVERLGGGPEEMGIGMLIHSGSELPLMFLSGYILKKINASKLMFISYITYIVQYILYILSPSLNFFYVVNVLNFAGYSIYGFASVLLVNDIVKENETVRGQALANLVYSSGLGGIVGNLICGHLIDDIGVVNVLLYSIVLMIIGALIMLITNKEYNKLIASKKITEK